MLDTAKMKKDDSATDFICGMRESEESKVRMVEEGASERFDEISIEGRDSIRREELLKYIRSNFEGLSLRNIESLKRLFYRYKIKF